MKLPMPLASPKTVFTLATAVILTILCLRHWLVPITARLSSMQQNWNLTVTRIVNVRKNICGTAHRKDVLYTALISCLLSLHGVKWMNVIARRDSNGMQSSFSVLLIVPNSITPLKESQILMMSVDALKLMSGIKLSKLACQKILTGHCSLLLDLEALVIDVLI